MKFYFYTEQGKRFTLDVPGEMVEVDESDPIEPVYKIEDLPAEELAVLIEALKKA